MHKNATFLILLGTLLVAGGVVLYERHNTIIWQTVSEQVSGTQENNGTQKSPIPKESTTGPFPLAERIVDPKTGWILFQQSEYVPISFLYPPEFKQTGARRFEWGGSTVDFQNSQYLFRVTIAGDGKGAPSDTIYDTTKFSLGNEVFLVDLLEETDAPPNLFTGWARNISGGGTRLIKFLDFL
ncbi:MAG: hypothetical protein A2756_04720 [Candidatus Ryanbacteria bacterium RIFCSPHIGHO2_01_FULL_48_27]|uniref:Uncharacterized protein n=1 Tax=Candidatus Ryanbacteria bacterium RIFCSPHIGHO2_01_FULL_48_27 TaxID=1802115 RepID=A0A1G2G465_9BACT|nr:MAG: hypothetical protein A2756_04720 [Candidatus Ryanbacteria bacterium RIFCSPHIGHO2_01_FULL_48_27]